jgi:hypothetical protein
MNNGSILAGNSHVQRLDWESAWASRFVVTSAVPSAQHGEISAEMLLQGSRFFEMPAAILTILILFCNAIALIFL